MDGEAQIGRQVLHEEAASPNYRFREVRGRRTGSVSWEIVDAGSGKTVASGLADRSEALRVVKGFERLSQALEDGLPGHVRIH